MTNNPTIDGVSREALLAAANQLSNWGKTIMAAPLWEALAAPVVERQPVAWMYKREGGEDLGQLVQMESDNLKCIRLGKCYDDGTRYMWPREDYIEWNPLYTAPPEVAALQSTIAQLQACIAQLESGRDHV